MAALNQHRYLTGVQLHYPKGFDEAIDGSTPIKDGQGNLVWQQQTQLASALDYVSAQSAPPTEVSGDIYLIDTTGTDLDINTIAWQSGNTIRYTFNGSPDLSAVAANDFLIAKDSTNSSNDGLFLITAVDNSTKYIEVYNGNRSDATYDEAADAVGTAYYTLAEWDGAQKGDHVRFNGTTWQKTQAQSGAICYDIAGGDLRVYSSTTQTWTDSNIISGGASGDVTKVGTPIDNQVGVWTGDGTIEGKTDFTYSNGAMNTIGEDASAYMRLTSYSDTLHWTNNLTFRSANGTSSTPTALLINEDLGSFIAQGHNGTAFVASGNEITWSAAENWSTGNNGVQLEVKTTPNGSASSVQRILIDGNGKTSISTALNIPNGATPTISADGDIGIDTTVTDFSTGIMKYYGGEEMGVVAMPIAEFTTPTDGHVVAYNATTDEFELVAASGGGISNVVDDTTPQLGGNLDVNGNKIVSVANGNIDIEPNGTGNVLLGNFTFDADQTVGAGQDNYVLTYDNGTGLISLEAAAGGGGSLWSELTTPDRLFYDDIVTIGDDNHTWSGTPTNGFLAVGGFNTIDAVQRGAIFGSSNTVGTVATAAAPFISGNSNIVYGGTSNTLFGSSNRTGYGNQNFGAGNINYVYGNRNIALGDNNRIGTTSVTRNDCITIGDTCYAYGGDNQILIGKGIQTNTSWATAKGIYFGIDSGRANAGFFKDPLAGSNWPTNFILGNRSAMRTDATGGIQSGTGAGIWYLYNEPSDTNIVEPTANLGNATAMWSKDRVAGVSGLLVKAENGSMSWVGDRIGINVTSSGTATAALTTTIDASLHVFGEGTGTTSGIKHENSSGTVTFETRDDGVIIASNLPTSSAGLPTGALWNNSGVINIV